MPQRIHVERVCDVDACTELLMANSAIARKSLQQSPTLRHTPSQCVAQHELPLLLAAHDRARRRQPVIVEQLRGEAQRAAAQRVSA